MHRPIFVKHKDHLPGDLLGTIGMLSSPQRIFLGPTRMRAIEMTCSRYTQINPTEATRACLLQVVRRVGGWCAPCTLFCRVWRTVMIFVERSFVALC